MLVCSVSLRKVMSPIAAAIVEAAAAADVVSTRDIDAGVAEAASAADAVTSGYDYTDAIAEAASAADASDGTVSVPSGTWNPSDKSANVALSNGNLTAQGTTTADGGVRSTTSRSSGKYYFEIVWSSNAGGGDTGCGIATSGANLGSIGVSAVNACLVFVSGNIYFNGSNIASI